MKRAFVILVALLALPLLADRRPIDATSALPEIGEQLPPFSAPLLDGGEISDRDLLGQPALVAIWSTDCPGSRTAVREMEALRQTFAPAGVRFVVLATDEDAARLREFVERAEMRSTIARANSQSTLRPFIRSRDTDPAEPYRIMFAKPSFLVVDAHGQIVARSGGYLNRKSVEEALERLRSE